MKYSDYDKLFSLNSIFSQRRRYCSSDADEMHCCENCKRYEYNEGTCKGYTDDPADDNDCTSFFASWVKRHYDE